MFMKYAGAFIYFPGGYGTLDEFSELLTLIQTLKVEAFPVVLYGSHYWTGLIDWLRKSVVGRYIEGEDLDIFRIVDTPEEAVRQVKLGLKHHWWKPGDKIVTDASKGKDTHKAPLASQTGNLESVEGTRYGKRPVKSDEAHLPSPRKA